MLRNSCYKVEKMLYYRLRYSIDMKKARAHLRKATADQGGHTIRVADRALCGFIYFRAERWLYIFIEIIRFDLPSLFVINLFKKKIIRNKRLI